MLSEQKMTVEEWLELGRENCAIQNAAMAICAFHNYRNKIHAEVSMAKMEPINIMIVDDHDTVRRGLTVFLRAFDDLQLVGEAANGLEAVNLCAEIHPHVILMDLVMPEMNGIEATRTIRRQWPEVQVIGLTSFKEEALAEQALQAGAVKCLRKDMSIDELANAIRSARTTNGE
jgi:NarL family two-component system response regulator LiaR